MRERKEGFLPPFLSFFEWYLGWTTGKRVEERE
jgi:hypothetical protein